MLERKIAMMLSLAAVLVLTSSANAEYLHWGVEVIGVAADSEWPHTPAVSTIDESGLAGDLHAVRDDAVQPPNTWSSRTAGTNHSIRYTFDQAYELGKVWVWNYNGDNTVGLGFRSVDVYYKPAEGEPDVLLGNYEFAVAPGTPDYAHNTEIDFGGVEAAEVFFQQITDWGHPWGAGGLSEVRFNLPGGGSICDPVDWNNDGVIDDLDLTELAVHWQQSVPENTQGDADGTGFVDDLDLTALAVCWPGAAGPDISGADVSAVPEPVTLSLLALLALSLPKRGGLAPVRRKRRNR